MPNGISTQLPLGAQLTLFSTNQGPLQVVVEPSASAGVTSFAGRTGAVVPQNGDYSSSQVTNASTVPGATVSDALNNLKDAPLTVVPIAGATYTLTAADAGKYLRFTNAGGCVVTANAGVFAAGQWVLMRQVDVGAITFAGSASLTPPVTNIASSGQKGATISLTFVDASNADVSGDLQDA